VARAFARITGGRPCQQMVEAQTTYRVNPEASRFTMQAFAEGLLSAFGHSPKLDARKFSGEVSIEDEKIETASLRFVVMARSLHVVDDVSEKDRLEIERATSDDVLEAAKYPEIVFQGRTVSADRIYEGFYRVKIEGEVLLHGVKRNQPLDFQVRVSEDAVRAEGEATLKQSDFGIKKVSVAGGTMRVKDEVKLTFLIVADKT
jgi:polyisoprenoid-binding protein YceI